MTRDRLRHTAAQLALAAVYWAGAALGFSVADAVRQVSPVWPPTGIALAALVRLGPRCWPGIAAGAFLANLVSGEPPWTAALVAAGNTLEALVGYRLLRRFGFDARVERMRDVYALLAAAVASTTIAATVGVASLWQADLIPPSATVRATWLVWWVGDAMGALVVTPVLLALTDRRTRSTPAPFVEAVAAFGVLAAVALVALASAPAPALGPVPNLEYLVFPVIVWIALRLGQREVIVAVTLISSVAIAGAIHDRGPFVTGTLTQRLVLLQLFMAVVATTALALGALVTERRGAYEEVRRANATKDQFLAVLSHELRTPLTPILGWVRLLRDGQLDAETVARAHEVIERNTRLQVRLVEDLLDASRIVAGKMVFERRRVDLARVIELAHEAVREAAAAKGVGLQIEPVPSAATCWGDAERLQQAVANVLANAVKFTPRGGGVRVGVSVTDAALAVIVSDNGLGVDPAFLGRMFAPFTQADSGTTRAHGGLGLGLSIAGYILDHHGGSATAVSPGLGRGTTVTLRLPRVRGAAAEAPPSPQVEAGGTPLAGLRVLAVDDDADACEMVRAVLSGGGAEVRTAGGSTAALATLDEWTPDMLVCDLAMPDGDGFQLLQTIRRREPPVALRAVLLTAYAGEGEARRALAGGYDVHLAKPVAPSDLLAALSALRAR